VNRLLTRDPASGGELVVTRLWSPASGVTIEGEFSLGWIGKLTPEQLDFVGVLLRCRNNLQRLAGDLGVSYNTARSRLDEIVSALGGDAAGEDGRRSEAPPAPQPGSAPRSAATVPDGSGRVGAQARQRVLDELAAGEITHEEALRRLRH